MSEALTMTSARGQQMLGYLPGYYASSRVMRSLMESQGIEMDQLQRALDETLAQFFVDTATWGLNRWESDLGIATDPSKPLDQRRSLVKSKLRGTGTVTVALMRSVAESFDNGSIEVTQQPSLCTVTIRFVDTVGRPPNLDDIKDALNAIVPAHLAVSYSFRYLTVNEVNGLTINQMQSHPLTDFAPFLDA
ncbi:YmfQ family protein [Cohnella sp. JJ-181]|uniref:YmfQ family protein n=1 Tax=Cohnella rhizoplanae TaxID=2974897 RepID=UPI00232C7E78|nr:YmfQ family protein [Cohnella sp. JJ-181]